jgi:pilus assembly protein CpaF
MLVALAGFDIPLWFIRRQIASALQIVVQTRRLSGGQRKIVQISEITGVQGEAVSMHDLFHFDQTGVDDKGAAQGDFHCAGIQPRCLGRLKSGGIDLPLSMFERRTIRTVREDAYTMGRGAT